MQLGKSDSESLANPVWNKLNLFKTICALPKPVLLGALFIVLATLAAYWPVFSAGFIWDDDSYVTENKLLSEADGWWRIWFSAHTQSQYFPLVYSTLRLEYAMWGLNPTGYHIVNVCLHILNALLVWRLLQRLAIPGAWLAAAVFALHPVQVETVAWVTELKNTESTLFYLLALLAWMNFCGGKSRWFYALAILFCALALFAKTTACTLPAVMLLVLWLKNEPVNGRRIWQMTPFLVMGLAMGLVSIWWEKHLDNYLPKYHLTGGLPDRLLIATHAVWFYAGKLFWPANLTFSYPHWNINAGDWRQYAWAACCLGIAVLLFASRRFLGRGPAVAAIFFVAVLSPMLGFIPLYTFYFTFVADHYQYLACLGLVALSVATSARLLEKWQVGRGTQLALAFSLLLVLGTLTWHQCGAYQNLETLWTDTLKKNPQSWMAHTNLGRLLAQLGNFSEAESNYLEALQINPDEEDIHYNYGNLLARTGRLDDAVTQYQQALRLAPTMAALHNNLGAVLLKQKLTDDAIAHFRQAIFYNPDYVDAHYNLGNALSAEHKLDEAVAEYEQVLRLEPDYELAKKHLRALGVPAN
jgi:tetratricopeptide (TPR) repeat protein